MNGKRWFWLGSLFVVVLLFIGLFGNSTQTALMQNDEMVSSRTAVSPQSPIHVFSQGEDTAVNIQSVNALIPDGSFENNPSLWAEATTNNQTCGSRIGDWLPETGIPAYDGNQYFWGGGFCEIDDQTGFVIDNSASMTVTIPTETPAISFWYWAYREDPDVFEDFAYVEAEIIDIGTYTLWSYALELANNTNGWVQETLDLSDFAGQEIILRFKVAHGTSQYAGNMFFDFVEFVEPAEQTWTVNPRSGGFFQYTTASGSPVTDFTIPPGAVDKETTISYKSATSAGFPIYPAGQSPLGVSLTYAGTAFDLEAFDEFIYLPFVTSNDNPPSSAGVVSGGYEGLTSESVESTNNFQFNQPIRVKIYYDEARIKEFGVAEEDLYLYYWTGDGWADAALSCAPEDYIDPPSTTYVRDTVNNWFELNVCHFTRFGTVGVN